jgi:hypothetical protein
MTSTIDRRTPAQVPTSPRVHDPDPVALRRTAGSLLTVGILHGSRGDIR